MPAADMKVVTVAGDNLFRIAAVELGDATQWIRIAELNQITDPVLIGVTTLVIPDINPSAGGGVAAQ
jgi:nucleoid-associated protein YgaU